MNAFYERLMHFGEVIEDASQKASQSLSDYFIVQHPGFPVVSATNSIVPKLTFVDGTPALIRKKVRGLLKKSFSRTKPA
ncbi:hypothetical protein [Mucilaginibacter lacusdianchii]|uniref:hypothetical protein n=1 Tax=Mucilaginibacter lacusdianchii TaxID=2684211 RepID=UPI00131CB544|nr:hypothetical protein [Mucilaginibacter sp. JXJ CY 39]